MVLEGDVYIDGVEEVEETTTEGGGGGGGGGRARGGPKTGAGGEGVGVRGAGGSSATETAKATLVEAMIVFAASLYLYLNISALTALSSACRF